MKRTRLRSRLFTATFIVLVAAAWWFFAPSQIGGSTTYVITHGISMEPRFHTGDLAIVRPTDSYKVGDVAAYHSTLLHVTVLHRIIARDGSRYVFKGDNNDFIDPTHPTQPQLMGKLWFRVPHGGRVLRFIHAPIVAAAVCALVGLLLLFGAGEKRQRNRRRRAASGSAPRGPSPVNIRDNRVALPFNVGPFLAAAAAAAALFLVLGLIAFTQPLQRTTTTSKPYTQRVTFGYSATAAPGPVYPTGVVKTGDPLFLALVHRLKIHIDYRLTSAAPHAIAGTEEVVLRVTAPSGWSRNLTLVPPTSFSGDHTRTDVALDLPRIQSLLAQVTKATGLPIAAGATIAVVPQVHIKGTVAGEPVKLTYKPGLAFALTPQQLQLGASAPTSQATGSTSASGGSTGLRPSQTTKLQTQRSARNSLKVSRVSLDVATLRWIAVVGLLLSAIAALFLYLRKRGEPFEETFRIQSQYGHMIVPIVAGEDLGWPPVDVPSIKALVRLAESGQRLILHNRSNEIDTYMVNDEGTVYRYQVRPSNVVWGEWSEAAAPVKAAA